MQYQNRKTAPMRYLGMVSGEGVLILGGVEIAPASYELEGYVEQNRMIRCGEICSDPAALRQVFGRGGLQLRTENGRCLDLTFSEKTLAEDCAAAHVDVTGDQFADLKPPVVKL